MFIKKSKLIVITVVLCLAFTGIVFAAHHGPVIHIDGRQIATDVDPQIIDGRTMVPIRFIAESFGADVHWLSETQTVQIISPAKKFAGDFMERGMYQITASEAMAAVNGGQAVILDVRPPVHRAAGYIAGSMYAPVAMIPDMMDQFDPSKKYMVYCVMDTNSAFAVAILNMAGIDAYVVTNGMAAFQNAGAATILDIVDTAVAAGSFNTLAAALTAADLIDALKGPGPFTVFAPTDDAFAALPAGTVEALLEDIPTLTEILLYHVVSGEYAASDVVAAAPIEVQTLQGSSISITLDGGYVYIDDAQVTVTDIVCSNGIIHVIDAVILP